MFADIFKDYMFAYLYKDWVISEASKLYFRPAVCGVQGQAAIVQSLQES